MDYTMQYSIKVAEMFGLEIGEEFKLCEVETGKLLKNRYRITCCDEPIQYYDKNYRNWVCVSHLCDIINGTYKIIKKQWKPKTGDIYFTPIIMNDTYDVSEYKWQNREYDLIYWKSGLCFQTYDEADIKGVAMLKAIQKEYESI